LRVVWISHPHADHHLGVVSLILERAQLLRAHTQSILDETATIEPLVVIAPLSVGRYLDNVFETLSLSKKDFVFLAHELFLVQDVCQACDPLSPSLSLSATERYSGVVVEDDKMAAKKRPRVDEFLDGSSLTQSLTVEMSTGTFTALPSHHATALHILKRLSVQSLESVPVEHCAQAYGLVLSVGSNNSEQPWTLVYSGDTRPCTQLVLRGRNASILIHEATFEDDAAAEALSKRHCTIGEALQVAQSMFAQRTLLTHFSQRYHGLPSQLRAPAVFHMVALDFLSLSARDLAWAPRLTTLLAELFPANVEEDEDTLALAVV
jgi:ribonuclease Z